MHGIDGVVVGIDNDVDVSIIGEELRISVDFLSMISYQQILS